MSSLKAVIEACDRAISQEDCATLMKYYADDAGTDLVDSAEV